VVDCTGTTKTPFYATKKRIWVTRVEGANARNTLLWKGKANRKPQNEYLGETRSGKPGIFKINQEIEGKRKGTTRFREWALLTF